MPSLFELKSQVVTLPLHEDEDSVTEALRREAEAENDPSVILSQEEFQRGLALSLC